jgi:hypothetical protein
VNPAARLKAAAHELRCWECRVTWTSWAQRLVGLKRGQTPRLSKRARHLVAMLRKAETERDEAFERLHDTERQVRAAVAAEYRDLARAIEASAGENRDPLAEALWRQCWQDGEDGLTHDDPRTIAINVYRHLADRLTEEGR